jgi:AcrR family transcriptional regulator
VDEIQDTQGPTVPKYLPIPGESGDARAVRTRDALASALIELMHERAFDQISVQDICERAQVGRSTFYAHFQDRDELFIRHIVEFARIMSERLVWDDAARSYRFPIAWLFDHVRQMRPLFDSLRAARKLEFVMKVWQNNFAEGFEQRVQQVRAGAVAPVAASVLAQHLAGSIITQMIWWMDHHQPHTAEEMERQFEKLVAGLG